MHVDTQVCVTTLSLCMHLCQCMCVFLNVWATTCLHYTSTGVPQRQVDIHTEKHRVQSPHMCVHLTLDSGSTVALPSVERGQGDVLAFLGFMHIVPAPHLLAGVHLAEVGWGGRWA